MAAYFSSGADGPVGLRFKCFGEPNQGVRRGRGVRPTAEIFGRTSVPPVVKIGVWRRRGSGSESKKFSRTQQSSLSPRSLAHLDFRVFPCPGTSHFRFIRARI